MLTTNADGVRRQGAGPFISVRVLKPLRHFGAAGYDQNPRYEVVDRVTAPDGLGIVTEFTKLREITAKPLKVCVPGPMTLTLPLIVKAHYVTKQELIEDVAGIVNAEMKELVRAGADYLQIDEHVTHRVTRRPSS